MKAVLDIDFKSSHKRGLFISKGSFIYVNRLNDTLRKLLCYDYVAYTFMGDKKHTFLVRKGEFTGVH